MHRGVAFEKILTTGRLRIANAKNSYAEPTRDTYEKMLDGMESSLTLANAHSDLDTAFDSLIVKNKYNVAYTDTGSVSTNLDHQ